MADKTELTKNCFMIAYNAGKASGDRTIKQHAEESLFN